MSPRGQNRKVAFCLRLSGARVILRVPVKRDGNACEQPDRGIAGRNSSADEGKERDLPSAFFLPACGPTSGRQSVPALGFGFEFGFETP